MEVKFRQVHLVWLGFLGESPVICHGNLPKYMGYAAAYITNHYTGYVQILLHYIL